MTRFTDLIGEVEKLVLTQLPSAFPEAVQQDIQEVIRQFYGESCTWRVRLGPFSRMAGEPHVLLTPPGGTAINLVHGATLNGFPLDPARAGAGRYWGWGADRPELLTIYPTAHEDERRVVWTDVSLLPVALATTVPESAVSHHLATITAGCLARFYGQPLKPWYNLIEARTQRNFWLRGMAQAKAIGLRGYTPTPMVAYNPSGWA
jgi:hypothetical protein